MIIGIGIDIVSIGRFTDLMSRRPALAERLFTEGERTLTDGSPRTAASLAARFAAKEAVAKALGAPAGMEWHDCQVVVDESGRPRVETSGTVAAASQAAGIRTWHLTLTHDADSAIAQAIGEA